MKILHQAGHNTSWNIQSLRDGIGDGIIVSAVHEKFDRVCQIEHDIRAVSLFDPQFYVPDSPKPKLATYNFFPSALLDEFSTVDYAMVAAEAAHKCIEFQINQDFDSIIVPSRFYPDLVPGYANLQKIFSVDAFLRVIAASRTNKRIFVTLPVTSSMISGDNHTYRNHILNWITSYPQISGVYLVNSFMESTKQIMSYDKLMAHMTLIHDLKSANLDVIVGYCNTEAVLLSICDPFAVTMGAYENTRTFTIDKFYDNDEERRGPAPRIYFPRLLNWMRWQTAVEIRQDYPDVWSLIYEPTRYAEELFGAATSVHFTKPHLYKHHFELMNGQLARLASVHHIERIPAVQSLINTAVQLYRTIQGAGGTFVDDNCSGAHLSVWNRVIRNWKP